MGPGWNPAWVASKDHAVHAMLPESSSAWHSSDSHRLICVAFHLHFQGPRSHHVVPCLPSVPFPIPRNCGCPSRLAFPCGTACSRPLPFRRHDPLSHLDALAHPRVLRYSKGSFSRTRFSPRSLMPARETSESKEGWRGGEVGEKRRVFGFLLKQILDTVT